nr:hypothetical protein [Pandoravirus aubagnensis]
MRPPHSGALPFCRALQKHRQNKNKKKEKSCIANRLFSVFLLCTLSFFLPQGFSSIAQTTQPAKTDGMAMWTTIANPFLFFYKKKQERHRTRKKGRDTPRAAAQNRAARGKKSATFFFAGTSPFFLLLAQYKHSLQPHAKKS